MTLLVVLIRGFVGDWDAFGVKAAHNRSRSTVVSVPSEV